MIIKEVNKIINNNILGLAIYPFIFVRKDYVKELKNLPGGFGIWKQLINHEKIHLAQEKEMLLLPFYVWYGLEWCIKSVKYHSWNIGYRNISFEKEAYTNESNFDYLQNRKIFSFLKYM